METKYVIIRSDTKTISSPMNQDEALSEVKNYDKQGISAYIVSEDEGNRIKNSHFNFPEWK